MLQEILTHTPLWVWFILLFLISRGVKASQDRRVTFKTMLLLPLFMLLWSLQWMVQHFGLQPEVGGCWILGLGLGLYTVLKFGNQQAVRLTEGGHFQLRGSWKPMLFLITLFVIKYAENVLVAMVPALKTEIGFVVGVSLVYGILNGLFLANFVRAICLTINKNRLSEPQTV